MNEKEDALTPTAPQISRSRLAPPCGRALALAAAGLFLGSCQKSTREEPGAGADRSEQSSPAPTAAQAAPTLEAEEAPEAPCAGVNECKGQSACHVTGAHTCAGQNQCKGKGWLKLTRAACQQAGGKLLGG